MFSIILGVYSFLWERFGFVYLCIYLLIVFVGNFKRGDVIIH